MSQTDPLIGTTVGNYVLEARLGSGGMGDVYRGVHRDIGAKVAIKILHATAAGDPEGAGRFQIEAQAGNRIEHPGVIKVLDAGQLRDGRPYMVMPLLHGRSLADVLAVTPRMEIDAACRIAIEILDAMAAAHGRGFVHRDLKPPNIFITTEGKVVILDFGVAKLMAGDSPVRLTRTGTAIGTPYYMAPEQIRELGVGPASDVYAVGVVMFEMLCGRLPFDGASAFDVMAGHLERRPPPPRALRPEIPIALQDVVLTALAKKPDKRYPGAGVMRDALRLAAAVKRRYEPPHVPEAEAPTVPMEGTDVAAVRAARTAVEHAQAAPASPPSRPVPAARSITRVVPWVVAAIAVAVAAVVLVVRGDAQVVATTPTAVVAIPAAAIDARPAAPDAARAPAIAAIDVKTTPPGAEVVLDGEPVGMTPLRLDTSTGGHRVEVRHKGYVTDVQQVDVQAGERVVVNFSLKKARRTTFEPIGARDQLAKPNPYSKDPFSSPRPDVPAPTNDTTLLSPDQPQARKPQGPVEIRTTPERAAIDLDGQRQGNAPYQGYLEVGRHTLVVRAPGHKSATREFEVAEDRNVVINVVLDKDKPNPF